MTNWTPALETRAGPKYLAIADALAEDIADGRLEAGEKLPTHRDLAYRLGVTIGTISRAYAEAERRGLTAGEVGRGTYVRGQIVSHGTATDVDPWRALTSDPQPATSLVDLSLSYPPPAAISTDFGRVLREIAAEPGSINLMSYGGHVGALEHRAAAAAWIAQGGYRPEPERMVVTAGAQHALLAALHAVARPGDRIGAERLTYTGLIKAVEMLGLAVEPIAMDEEGLLPDAVERACRSGVKAISLVPTLQNPTTAIMSAARREAIAEIAVRHDVPLIEDDLFALLSPNAPPPNATLIPDHVLYVTSLSKTVAPGLRIGYLAAPERWRIGAVLAVRSSTWMAPPLMAEVASRWIADGTARRVLESHRREGSERMALARRALAGYDVAAGAGALHLWLKLPPPWQAEEFSRRARDAGVIIASQAPFLARQPASPATPIGEQAVRVCLGGSTDRDRLAWALDRVAGVLRAGPESAQRVPELASIV